MSRALWQIWAVLVVIVVVVGGGGAACAEASDDGAGPRASTLGMQEQFPNSPARPAQPGKDKPRVPPQVLPKPEAPGEQPYSPLPPRKEGKLKVVATVSMLGDLVAQIGGDRIELTTLMGAGVDPHLYRPTRTDIAAILEADIVFYNGLFLEGKMSDALLRASTAGRTVVPVGEKIDQSKIIHPGHEGSESTDESTAHADPHIWMDPELWSLCVPVVRDELSKADPNGMLEFGARATQYERELSSLRAYAEKVLKSVPEDSRVLVTAHDAFEYFGRRYGYEVVGIQGISTESEAGVRDIERIVSLLVEKKIKAVFVESTVSERNVKALIDGAKQKGHGVVIGGELFSDAMGPSDEYTGTYLGMIDHNVTTISQALGGDAPAGGWRRNLPMKERK